jgi:3alpha(or 20beta)-hydroxysteroid dehydrogenase
LIARTANFDAENYCHKLVKAAGIMSFRDLLQRGHEDFERMIRVNLVGEFLGIKAVALGVGAAG